MMTCVLCYSRTESPKDPLGSAHSPNHGWPQVFSCVVYCVLSFEECQVVGIIQLQPSRSTSFTQSFAATCPPYCLMVHSSTGQHSTCPGVPQLLHSPKEEYLFASKFGQLWIKLLSTFMCSFLGGHTFSTDLGRGQEVCNGWIYKSIFPFARTCHVILQGARSTPIVPLLPNLTNIWNCLCIRPF